MAIWKDRQPADKPATTPPPAAPQAAAPPPTEVPRTPAPQRGAKESIIASDLIIEGKIEGTGNVRIAGKFTGDVIVQGDVTVEAGARVNGGVRAHSVIVAGELEGNVEAVSAVQLMATGVLTGDLKAGSLTAAAGSRMRGRVEFGWETSRQQ